MKIILPVLLVLTTLACGVSTVPLSAAILPSPAPTASPSPLPAPTVTEVIVIRTVNITISTDLHIRACASLACEVITVAPAGTVLSAVCSGDWCMVPAYGWFCLPAAELRGGCK